MSHMALQVTTHYQPYPNSNVGKVVAKFGGRQATVRWQSALNSDQNHQRAAELLLDRLDLGFRVTTGRPAEKAGVWVWQAENPNNGETEGYATYYTFRLAVESWNDHGTFDAIVKFAKDAVYRNPDVTDAELGQQVIDYVHHLSDLAMGNQRLPRTKNDTADRSVLAGLHHIDWDTVNAEDIGRQTRQTLKEETTYTFDVQGNYGHGFETVTAESTKSEAQERLREYRANEPGVPFRVRRVKEEK